MVLISRPGKFYLRPPSLQAPLVSVVSRTRSSLQEYYWEHLARLLSQRYPNTVEDGRAFDPGNPAMSESAVKMCRSLLEKLDDLEEKENEKLPKEKRRKLAGAVLVFLPGIQEIQRVREFLIAEEGGERRSGPEWCCIPLHSSIPWEEHQAIFDILPANQRKIILSTNIAESSLTVPDIRYVIDFCLTKNLVADKDTNYPR